jgi:hypothetical protein
VVAEAEVGPWADLDPGEQPAEPGGHRADSGQHAAAE